MLPEKESIDHSASLVIFCSMLCIGVVTALGFVG